MNCPLCAQTVPMQQPDCPSCGAGLAEYAAVYYFPDQLFNDGVVALSRGQYALAATQFAAVCGLRSDDGAALQALGHALTHLGRQAEAPRALPDAVQPSPSLDWNEQHARPNMASGSERVVGPAVEPEVPAPQQTPPTVRWGRAHVKSSRASRRRAR